ncbi:MAG: ArsR family transcriptional regulator [Promethearchaeota archaeon]
MKNFCSLLFELSHEDRLRILHKLVKERMNVTSLSKALNLTTQETSRHLSRLSEVDLIQKDAKGLNHVTEYGELVLKQLDGLRFISRYADYFRSRSLTHLPREFISRIGDLSSSKPVNEVAVTFANIEKMAQEAKEFILTITDQYLISKSTLANFTEAYKRGVTVKNIESLDWVALSQHIALYTSEDIDVRNRARSNGILLERFGERIDLSLYVSEKEVAVISFPTHDGRFDYLGFASKDERTRKWCVDAFRYYWSRARDGTVVADERLRWIRDKPKAVSALRRIAAGKAVPEGKEMIPELESMHLIRNGVLTQLGRIVLRKLK